MKDAVYIAVDQLVVSEEFQMRLRLDRQVVDDYAQLVKERGGEWPFVDPCTAYRVKSELILVDGFHRVAAVRQAGEDQVLVMIHEGSRLDAKKAAFGANQSHGLRLTNADKRHKVTIALQDAALQKWSDRKLAELCGVHHELVGRIRAELADSASSAPTSISEPLVSIGSDGKARPATKADADLQRARVATAIQENSKASNRQIAAAVGCDDKTVGKVRAAVSHELVDEIEEAEDIVDDEPDYLLNRVHDLIIQTEALLLGISDEKRASIWKIIVQNVESEVFQCKQK